MKRGIATAVTTVLVLALLPSGAAAKPKASAIVAVRQQTITFSGRKGFTFQVGLLEVETTEKRLTLLPSVRAERGRETAEYKGFETPHVGSDGTLAIHVEGVGRVRLHFHPTKKKSIPLGELCDDDDAFSLVTGTFSGRIDLRGRRGFTAAHHDHAEGKIFELDVSKCPNLKKEPDENGGGKKPGRSRFHLRGMRIERRGSDRTVNFSTTELRLDRLARSIGTSFTARAETRDHGVDFVSSVEGFGEDSIFEGRKLKSITNSPIEPPSPFTGSAEFDLLSPRQATWTGDLAVELPGFGEVPLAGPRFAASIYEDERSRGDATATEGVLFSRPPVVQVIR